MASTILIFGCLRLTHVFFRFTEKGITFHKTSSYHDKDPETINHKLTSVAAPKEFPRIQKNFPDDINLLSGILGKLVKYREF